MHLEKAFYFNRFNFKISETFTEFEYKTVSVNNAHSKWENYLLKELNLAIYAEVLGLCCTKWHFSYCILIHIYLNPE